MLVVNIDFFRKEAKKFFKDWKNFNAGTGCKYYDVEKVFSSYGRTEEDVILARSQHIIAVILGFRKWNDLIHASDEILRQAASVLIYNFRIDNGTQRG